MWLPDQSADEIDSALRHKRFGHIDRLLENVFKNGQPVKDAARACPVCKKALVSRALPYLELVVKACSDGHGAWMHPQACTELWEVIADHIANRTRKRKVLLTMLSFCSLLLLFDILTGAKALRQAHDPGRPAVENALIGPGYWPMRDTSGYALPLKESSLNDLEELYYFKLLTDHLDIILSNRINMASILESKRSPEQYEESYAYFFEQQSLAAESLKKVEPPAKLAEIHRAICEAVVMQIGFYADFTEEKVRRPETGLDDMLRHQALVKSNGKLLQAWQDIQALYPELDEKTSLAIESRLCWTDII